MKQHERTPRGSITRRSVIATGAALIATAGINRIAAQTPEASPVATPVATPGASPAASPVGSPAPEHPLAIVTADDMPDDDEAPRRGGTLRLPVSAAHLLEFVPTTQRQDPQVAWSYLDALVRIDPSTSLPAPSLAASWTWSDDGTTLTFTLRDDVTWHDGTAFTAADAQFAHIAYRDDYRSAVAAQSGLVAGIEAVDDVTLRVQFDEPDGAWLFNVASLPIVQAAQYRQSWEANPEGERTLDGNYVGTAIPVGTGPWMITSVEVNGIELERNAAYFAGAPHADRLKLIAVNANGDATGLWQRGELDIAGQVDAQRVETLLDTPGRLVVSDAPRSLFAVYNFENTNRWNPALLADPALRDALSLALDRERYADDVWGGFLQYDRPGLATQQWVESTGKVTPKRKLDEARKLLSDAGWRDINGDGILESPVGDTLVLTTLLADTAQPAVLETLEAMRADLWEVGALLDLQVVSPDRFVTWWSTERTWDLLVYDLRLYPAFAEFDLVGSAWDTRVNADGWNPGGYANPDADAAIAAYFQAVEPASMAEALSNLQDAIVNDPPALWIGAPQELTAVSPDVRGFVPNPLWSTLDTRTVWFAEE